MNRAKVSVIGAGMVGGTTAQRLAELDVADVALVDIVEGLPQGKGLDLMEAGPVVGYDSRVEGSTDYAVTEGSDVVVVTSGLPRKPGMSRDDLLQTNFKIVKSVTESVVKYSPQAVLIVVSNPLDAMTYTAYKVSGFPRERVMGMAGVLDTARFRYFLAEELDVSREQIQSFVLGGHGDTMVPVLGYTTVAGIPVEKLLPKEKLDALVKRTQEGGAEIVQLLKTGSAFYAPSAAIVEMVESLLFDKRKILPCCALCQGEYGVENLFVGVPVKLGAGGMEKIIEVPLSEEERRAFDRSVAAVKELTEKIDGYLTQEGGEGK